MNPQKRKRKRVERHLRVKIDLSAIENNLNILRSLLNSSSENQKIIAVVKADAYGHGADRVSLLLQKRGVDMLAVAFGEEAIRLRRSGISIPILVLFDNPGPDLCIRYQLTPVIHDIKTAELFSDFFKKRSINYGIHLKIDTGMGRMGIDYGDAMDAIRKIKGLGGLIVEGIMSHLAEAELRDMDFVMEQLNRFKIIYSEFKDSNTIFHIANSAATMNIPESRFDAVRPGLMLYGYGDRNGRLGLRPAMKVYTELLAIRRVPKGRSISYGRTFITERDSLIGIIPAGYADGIMRILSNNTYVLVRGRRVPVVGRICMDLTMIDLTDMEDVREGDEVVIMGSQDGEAILADEIAERAFTIPYEILTTFARESVRWYD